MMNQLLADYVSEQNMAHPDFPKMGLGKVAYVHKLFDRHQFVYTLTAADGEPLLQKEDWLTVQEFITEYNLKVITLH